MRSRIHVRYPPEVIEFGTKWRRPAIHGSAAADRMEIAVRAAINRSIRRVAKRINNRFTRDNNGDRVSDNTWRKLPENYLSSHDQYSEEEKEKVLSYAFDYRCLPRYAFDVSFLGDSEIKSGRSGNFANWGQCFALIKSSLRFVSNSPLFGPSTTRKRLWSPIEVTPVSTWSAFSLGCERVHNCASGHASKN